MIDVQIIKLAKKLIKEFEGLRLQAYKCPAGINTIGWGHAIFNSNDIVDNISKQQAEALLEIDISKAASCLYRNCRNVNLNIYQQAALISFIFNLGGGCFQSSTLRQKLLRGEFVLAGNELDRFIYAGGKKLNGLIRRRAAERKLFETRIVAKIDRKVNFGILTRFKNYIYSYA